MFVQMGCPILTQSGQRRTNVAPTIPRSEGVCRGRVLVWDERAFPAASVTVGSRPWLVFLLRE